MWKRAEHAWTPLNLFCDVWGIHEQIDIQNYKVTGPQIEKVWRGLYGLRPVFLDLKSQIGFLAWNALIFNPGPLDLIKDITGDYVDLEGNIIRVFKCNDEQEEIVFGTLTQDSEQMITGKVIRNLDVLFAGKARFHDLFGMLTQLSIVIITWASKGRLAFTESFIKATYWW